MQGGRGDYRSMILYLLTSLNGANNQLARFPLKLGRATSVGQQQIDLRSVTFDDRQRRVVVFDALDVRVIRREREWHLFFDEFDTDVLLVGFVSRRFIRRIERGRRRRLKENARLIICVEADIQLH